jgi:hypothetical protein
MRQRRTRRPIRNRLVPPPPVIKSALRRTVEGLTAVGTAFGPITVFAWLDDERGPARQQSGPAVQLSRAERRQWARLVKQLR